MGFDVEIGCVIERLKQCEKKLVLTRVCECDFQIASELKGNT